MRTRWLWVLLLSLAAVIHAVTLARSWGSVALVRSGNDFASYYYAVQVALDGGDPYLTEALTQRANADHTARAVFPFLYPPPFVLVMSWVRPFSLGQAYRAWFFLDELFLLLGAAALWRGWRPLGPVVLSLLALALATWTAFPNNHFMGQVNHLVFALAMGGLWADRRGHHWAGGALVGVAAMLKMSPALFVLLWLVQGRWRPVLAAVLAGGALALASLAAVGVEGQVHFWGGVLLGFAEGDYNGLRVPIGIFGNHSLPDLWNALLPGGGEVLSPGARVGATVSTALLLGWVGWSVRRAAETEVEAARQVGAVGVLMLLLPVYTYEHHLVWALPAAVWVGRAVWVGALGRGWWAPVALAWAGLAWSLVPIKRLAHQLTIVPALALEEWKHLALWVLLLGVTRRR
ncbi:MAG: DUF2029 domain-containing protein [Deltaproteobacteria bacterium]|nr:DUF2029 domain-containing protein [Deltaproteobacteria bacterium]